MYVLFMNWSMMGAKDKLNIIMIKCVFKVPNNYFE